jgi:hypothetical protein
MAIDVAEDLALQGESASPPRGQWRETRLLHMRGGFADHYPTVSIRKRG